MKNIKMYFYILSITIYSLQAQTTNKPLVSLTQVQDTAKQAIEKVTQEVKEATQQVFTEAKQAINKIKNKAEEVATTQKQ